jgi:hypothetical protein
LNIDYHKGGYALKNNEHKQNQLIDAIGRGFKDEKSKYKEATEVRSPLIQYLRPVLFTVILSVTLIALMINIYTAVMYFLGH